MPDLADRGVGTIAVGLVDDEHVPDLEDSGLGCLHPVPHARRQQHYRRIGQSRDLDFTLAHPDGFDDHHVAPRAVEHTQRLRRSPTQAAKMPTAGHGSDVDLRVQGMIDHPDPVAE